MKPNRILLAALLAAIIAATGGLFAATSARPSAAKRGPVARATWPMTWMPDNKATMRTKLGEIVSWESMGPVSRDRPQDGQADKKFGRYPRYFRGILDNNGTGADPIAKFDLYDIGAQRHRQDIELSFEAGATNIVVTDEENHVEIKPDANGYYLIPYADYDRDLDHRDAATGKYVGDRPRHPVSLSFKGSKCVVRVYRAKNSPDEDEGSPPPPDPGNDSIELP
jgi:hypothetical protein